MHPSVHPSRHTYVHACMHTHTSAEARESLLCRPFPHAHLSCLSSRLMGTCGTLCFGACRSRWGLTRFLAQTAEENLSYTDAIQGIIKSDGIQGLLGRGLGTRLVTTGLQVLIIRMIKFVSSSAMLSPPCMCVAASCVPGSRSAQRWWPVATSRSAPRSFSLI